MTLPTDVPYGPAGYAPSEPSPSDPESDDTSDATSGASSLVSAPEPSPGGDVSSARQACYLAESVFNAALDILADEGAQPGGWEERRAAFRALVSTVIVGLGAVSPNARKAQSKRSAKTARKRAAR